MASEFIDELGRTTRSKDDYFKEAKKIWDSMPRGSEKWPAIREALGTGYWTPKGGTEKVEYMIKANPGNKKWGFQRSQINPGKGTKGRTGQMADATATRKINAAPSSGREKESIDWVKKHITDWNAGKNPWNTKLTSIDPEFRQWEHRIKVSDPFWKSGHDLPYTAGDVENFTWTNPKQVDLKNTGEMKFGKNFIFDVDEFTGNVIYTPRKGFDPHSAKFKTFTGSINEQALAIAKQAKKTKAVKAAKPLLKTAGKAVPYLGLGIAGAVMTNDVKAAYNNPSLGNIAKVGLSTIDTGLEVVDAFTAGLSTPITMALQLGLEGIRHNIDHGNAKISTRDRKLYRR